MNRKMTFCEECRRDVKYSVETALIKARLKGKDYEYSGKRAVCKECKSEIYVADIEDENLKALYDSYRQKNNIISLEKILEIPKRYNIGKRPLSLLLGWGEMTFSRYCDGDMPTNQYSEILQRIYDDPAYYKELLDKNKDNLRSSHTYEKSKRKVDELLGKQANSGSKLDLIIQYMLYKCEDITPLALQKALYYVQGFYYAFEKRFCFDDDCEAWVHGPVYRDIYNKYSSYKFDPIESIGDFDESVFTTSEKAILDSVIKNFCCYSGNTLERFTHLEEPWLHIRSKLPVGMNSNIIIPKELISGYFIAVKEKFHMLTPGDIEKYSKDIFKQVN
ncbi:type II toxin-antitoxin system antitoxin SocA domain-containing protein [Thermodesulfobium sp. 4217-1]|uniref:type II toxin-antitoxin system antitoxin SocA domain-containing protein n=1 Tax=Thermodesulfobium sp. 4217-1 TaxID=3120013 RepID=UPI0032221669